MKIFSPTISGSSQTSGSLTISGSLNVSQGITGSLLGTASWAINVVNGGGGGSVGTLAQVTALGASTTVPITASIISASSFTGSLFGTASWAQSASNAINARTASFINNLNQDLSITGAVIISGSSLPELRVIGDTQFTGSINSLNGYTGSLLGTSSWATNALTASFAPSYLLVSQTSSFVQNSQTSSFVQNSQTSSFVQNSQTSSMLAPYVLTSVTSSMLAPYTLNSQTSSFVRNTQTSSMTVLSSSFAATASFINNLNQNLSITGAVVISGSALPELKVIGDTQFTGSINSFNGYTGSLFGTASFATTASFASNGGVTSIAAGSGISINQSTGNVIITNASAGGATFPYTGSAIISGSLIITGNLDTTQGGIDAIRIKETSLTNAGQYDRGVTLADTWSSSGPALTAGRVVYLSGSGQWAEAVASATGSSTGVLGVVTTTANQNDIVLHGLVRVSQSLAGFTNGRPVYLSPLTAGIVTETPPSTSGQVGRYVGYIIDSASRQIYFNPDFTWIQL
jgi:hypothetical protein